MLEIIAVVAIATLFFSVRDDPRTGDTGLQPDRAAVSFVEADASEVNRFGLVVPGPTETRLALEMQGYADPGSDSARFVDNGRYVYPTNEHQTR